MVAAEALRIARPVINLDGRDQSALTERLMALTVVESLGGLYRCEALFGNWGSVRGQIDYLFFDRRTLDFGKPFKVKLGADPVFDGRVMALEALFPEGAARSINVLAEDRLQDLRMARRTRTFNDMTDAAVFDRVARDHGLTPSVSVSGPTHKLLAQVNQSDLAFVRERARALGAEVWIDGTTLHVETRPNRAQDALELVYERSLREFAVIADLATQCTQVVVSGWDVAAKTAIRHEAGVSVIQNELNGDTSGVSILEAAVGARKETLAHTAPVTDAEAQAEAEAYFRMSARRFVVGRGITEADHRLRVGKWVDLKNLGAMFSGKYYLTEVRHIFDGGGIRTEFTAERPGIGRA